MDESRKEIARALLQFGKQWPRGTVTDVYCWSEEHVDRYAFTGDPRKVTAHWMNEDHPIQGRTVDRLLRQVFSLDETSFSHEREVSLPDFLDRISGNVLYDVVSDAKRDGFFLTFIPEPGYPWPTADGEYYSAAKNKMLRSERPAWIIDVPNDLSSRAFDDKRPTILGVNPCLVFPSDETKCTKREMVARFSRGGSFMVAHSMSFRTHSDHKSLRYAIDGVKNCGGLLFPSLSVGEIPASNFGHVTLVAPVEIVVESLKPYRVRNRRPCWVYDTDAWTAGTSELMKSVAVRLYDELHGHEDWIYGSHSWVLGPPRDAGSVTAGFTGEPIDTMAQLGRAVRSRIKHWGREQSLKKLTKTWEKIQGTKHSYGYSEAKAREVVDINTFPLLIAPRHLAHEVSKFVAGVGYDQQVEFVDASDLPLDESQAEDVRRWAEVQWAWRVRDEVEAQSSAVAVDG